MNTNKLFYKITILFVLLVMFMTACTPKPESTPVSTEAQPTAVVATQAPEYIDTFTFATSQEPTLLDPAIVYDGSDRITRLIYESLLNYKGSSVSELEPALATGYTVSDDGLTYTFTLRQGVTFQDGTAFNADAVKFSFDRMITIGKGFAWAFWMLKEVNVVDEFTVDFVLTQQFPFFPTLIANRYGSPIVSPSIMQHEVDGDLAETWMQDHAIGTGPYIIINWDRSQSIVLDYSTGYWRGWTDKNIKHVIALLIPESSTMRQMLERGEILSANYPGVDDTITLMNNSEITVVQAPENSSNFNWFILFNTQKGIFQDVKVREAISWAFPYENIVNVAFKGQSNQSFGPLPDGEPGFASDLFQYHQDMEKARQLLAEAGIQPGTEIKVTYGSHDWGIKLLDALTVTLSDLGFKVTSEALGWSAMTENMANQETAPDIVIADWWDDYPDGVGYIQGVAGQFWWGGGREEKDYFYYNQEVVDLLNQADAEVDLTRRYEVLHQAQELIIADIPAIWAFDYYAAIPFLNNVKGYVFNSHYIYTFNLYDMWVEKP
ncbi:MAG: hypothetical protein A2030_08920 [Chloroflexi bacterium RBG_19FT_COMBO_50_10]|nr:MAG: hypothetical protein A2030_08920 [Chloroflexi bacterium RBG_19FT_COMBO_50_10]